MPKEAAIIIDGNDLNSKQEKMIAQLQSLFEFYGLIMNDPCARHMLEHIFFEKLNEFVKEWTRVD